MDLPKDYYSNLSTVSHSYCSSFALTIKFKFPNIAFVFPLKYNIIFSSSQELSQLFLKTYLLFSSFIIFIFCALNVFLPNPLL